jgi:hypothetical protein
VEVCDGEDNDLDGLIDEVSAQNGTCGPCDLFQSGGQAFFFCNDLLNWEQAVAACEAHGADLAVIHDAETSAFIGGHLPAEARRWIGATRTETISVTWRWVDDSAFDFSMWAGGQPDSPGAENCVELWTGSTWNDLGCMTAQPYACNAMHAL